MPLNTFITYGKQVRSAHSKDLIIPVLTMTFIVTLRGSRFMFEREGQKNNGNYPILTGNASGRASGQQLGNCSRK